jgi:hypothetical protein
VDLILNVLSVLRVLRGGERAVYVLLLLLVPRPASAQVFEDIGTRAQGMGGAFVALANDATATWWNPAGLASGPYFSGIGERGYALSPSEETRLGIAFALPSLGLSYYRIRLTVIPASGSTASTPADRQDQGTTRSLPTFVIHQFGATVGQSVGEHLVLGSTLKLVHADETRGDLDIGAMVTFGSWRAGTVVKHLHAPDLTVDGARVGLDRQLRVGAAYGPRPGPALTVNAAIDADATTTATAFGNARHVAAGAELWIRRRLAVRTGVSANTIDALRGAYSLGASAAVQNGLFVDARVTRGDDEVLRGWGFDLRVTF